MAARSGATVTMPIETYWVMRDELFYYRATLLARRGTAYAAGDEATIARIRTAIDQSALSNIAIGRLNYPPAVVDGCDPNEFHVIPNIDLLQDQGPAEAAARRLEERER